MKARVFAVALFTFYVQMAYSRRSWVGWANIFRRPPTKTTFPDNQQMFCIRCGSLESEKWWNSKVDTESEFPSPAEGFEEVESLSLIGSNTKARHCSDVLLDLRRSATMHGDDNEESISLRKLVASRSLEYLDALREIQSGASSGSKPTLPHPQKLLHFLAPKVPAIKHSPNVNLRIYSGLSDIDSGIAACIIGTMGHVLEEYDKTRAVEAQRSGSCKATSVATELITDRRFGQLLECLTSGVNLKKRKREALQRSLDAGGDVEDIEDLIDEESPEESDGLSVRDACRAAWGMAILGVHHLETMGGEQVLDVLRALSLRIRELLLARLKVLRQDDVLSEPSLAHKTIEERMNELALELAEDAASALWTFACVRASTGLSSVPLFETCCSILCQDPFDLRRRAQEVAENGNAISVGNDDAVDRLANAGFSEGEKEGTEVQHATSVRESTTLPHKDTLLDWLSVTQMNDVVWALALHGRENVTSSGEDLTLSTTATTLGEIALDRLIGALEEDLKNAENENQEANKQLELTRQNGVQVDVVDAATLLATQAQESEQVPTESIQMPRVESMRLTVGSVREAQVHQVDVVDAATILTLERDKASTIGNEVVDMKTPRYPESCEILVESNASREISTKQIAEGLVYSRLTKERTFSPHDLASIAWSVIELHDPLRMQVLPIVIKLVAMLGESGTKDLSGADLANLAWAISKFEAESSVTVTDGPSSVTISVLSRICNTAIQRVNPGDDDAHGSHESRVLEQFQPPELARLLWAVACVSSTHVTLPNSARMAGNIPRLANLAVMAGSRNLSLFGTEDLLRICWAFLELCSHEQQTFDPAVSVALGRILSTVEQSLYRWERGDCTTGSASDSGRASFGHDVSLFSSFFGKSRYNQPLFEQLVGDYEDDEENELAPILKKSRRPVLRDLSVDPSTLCKASCAFQRLLVDHPDVKGGWKLTSVAIRLLTSKNARLMRECSIHDLVRLCEAAVRSGTDGPEGVLVTRLFAHKVVQVLNDVFAQQPDTINDATSIKIESARPAEIATLVWALGDMGVKLTVPDGDSRPTAHRRLHLMTDKSLLTMEEVKSMDTGSVMKMLKGLVLMKCFQSDPSFLILVLQKMRLQAENLDSIEQFCSLAETLALLKEALKSGDCSDGSDSVKSSKELPANTNVSEKELNHAVDESTSSRHERQPLRETTEDDMVHLCNEMLSLIASKTHDKLKQCRVHELRRLLSVYSLLPFQADNLIRAIEKEVEVRIVPSDDFERLSLHDILQDAKVKSEIIERILFQRTDSSTLSAVKNGVMSLFRAGDKGGSDESSLPEELALMIRELIALTVKASELFQDMHSRFDLSIDSIGQQASEGAHFELGRCQELIANYRLVEFSTGTRRSRYDQERRMEISKRVLSRLLP